MENEINLCRLCLANSQTVRILNDNHTIEMTLKKHNIAFEKGDVNNTDHCSNIMRRICEMCWTKVSDFDEFYVRCERIHAMYLSNVLKRPDDTMDEKCYLLEPLCIINSDSGSTTTAGNTVTADREQPAQHIDRMESSIKTESIADELHAKGVQTNRRSGQRKLCTESHDVSGKLQLLFLIFDVINCQVCCCCIIYIDVSSDSIPLNRRKRKTSKKLTVKPVAKQKKKIRPAKEKESTQEVDKIEMENIKLIRKFAQMSCDICRHEVQFDTFTDCKNHYRDVHDENGYVQCCTRKFHRIGRIIEHCMWHENPEAFK